MEHSAVQEVRVSREQMAQAEVDEQRTLLAAYAEFFRTRAGEIILTHWEKTLGRRISFVPNDPYFSAYQEGQRSVLLETQENMEKGLAL